MMYDVATAIDVGRREYQEDAVAAEFNVGQPFGFAVLSDGMGGHAAGDVASKIVVTEVYSELKLKLGGEEPVEQGLDEMLRSVADIANACIDAHVTHNPALRGMGATLVAPVLFENRLYWLSIGDSPLFLFRDGSLKQLNQDHSMAPQIDLMVKAGMIDEETARNHPDRNALTSVVMGRKIPKIDCKGDPLELLPGDVVIAASDGLQFLTNDEIETVLTKVHHRTSAEIADILLKAIQRLDDPDQDNVSIAVIKFG